MKHYLEQADAVLREVDSCEQGLTAAEAEERLVKNGKNKLEEAKKDSLIKRFFQQMADPMIIILLAAAAISAVLAVVENESFADVIIILFVVIVNAVLGVYQESKAEKAIEALQQMAAATSKVLRDGQTVTIRSEDLVVGDVVLLEAGDAVPADGRVLESASMKVEEAALTGESVPVTKFIDLIHLRNNANDVPLGDRKNMVYMGSTVVYGRGRMVVTQTGMDTEMGKIADALANAQEGQTPLQRKLTQLSGILTKLVLVICVLIFGVQLLRAGEFTLDVVLHSFMIAVSLAVAAIPEGLATVVTVVLSIGVTNMSKRHAVIRRLTAVETLGCTQVICSDKTGTLTQNKMTVVEHTGPTELLAAAMTLCNDANLADDGAQGEPTEAALVNFGAANGLKKYELEEKQPRIGEAPFDSSRKMMSTLHDKGGEIVQYTKGAPDEVLARCAYYMENGKPQPMTEAKRAEILQSNHAMAAKALRVLAAAERLWHRMPENTDPSNLEQELCFIGLVGMIDPVRPEVRAAVEECKAAGIRPVMITGDHVVTASAIAKELGILEEGDKAITGAQLDAMSEEQLDQEVENISVYARVSPENKIRIVKAWQRKDQVVSMTGDGVNDAPALKAADIGCAMGITGTDVAKGAADMTLTDDNFATIVDAVREGRGIYANIKKVVGFLLGTNIGEVITVFAAMLLWHKTPLLSMQLLWINLVTDSLPAISLGMEAVENDVMEHSPKPKDEGIFAHGLGIQVVLQGCMFAILTLIGFVLGERYGGSLEAGQTMAFMVLSLTQIVQAFNMRSEHSLFKIGVFTNHKLNWAALLSVVLVCLVLFTPVGIAFGMVTLPAWLYLCGLGLILVPLVVMELAKAVGLVKKRHGKKQ